MSSVEISILMLLMREAMSISVMVGMAAVKSPEEKAADMSMPLRSMPLRSMLLMSILLRSMLLKSMPLKSKALGSKAKAFASASWSIENSESRLKPLPSSSASSSKALPVKTSTFGSAS